MTTFSLRLVKDVAIYGGGEILMRATGFLTLPIYTRVLATDEYGAWGFLTTAVGLLAAILAIGGDSAYARYYFECKSLRERQTLTSTWFGFLGLWTALVSIALAALSHPVAAWFLGHPSYALAVAFAIVSTPLTLVNALLGEVLRNQFRPVAFTVLNVLGAALLVGATVLFVVVLKKGLTGLAFSMDVSLALLIPIRIWTVRDHLRWEFSVPLLRRLLAFGGPLVPVSIAYWIFAVSDRFVLAKLSTLRELGLYTVAAAVTAALALVQAALSRAWSPHAVRLYEDDRESAGRIFGHVLTYILLLFAVMCVAVSTFAHELLVVLTTQPYYGAAIAVGPLTLGYLAYATTQITGMSITLTKQTTYFARASWGAALLNLALNLALVPIWGMLASAWATAAAYLYLTIAYLRIGQRLWPVEYDIRRALTISVAAIAFTIAAPELPDVTSMPTLLLKVGYVLAFCAALVATGSVRRDDWRRARAQLRPAPLEEAGT